jgi:hypothetical protein
VKHERVTSCLEAARTHPSPERVSRSTRIKITAGKREHC